MWYYDFNFRYYFFTRQLELLKAIHAFLGAYMADDSIPLFFENEGYKAKLIVDATNTHAYMVAQKDSFFIVFHELYAQKFGKVLTDDTRFSWPKSILDTNPDVTEIYCEHVLALDDLSLGIHSKTETKLYELLSKSSGQPINSIEDVLEVLFNNSQYATDEIVKLLAAENEAIYCRANQERQHTHVDCCELNLSNLLMALQANGFTFKKQPLAIVHEYLSHVASQRAQITKKSTAIGQDLMSIKALCAQHGFLDEDNAFVYNDLDNSAFIKKVQDKGYLVLTDQNLGFLIDIENSENYYVYAYDKTSGTNEVGEGKKCTSLQELLQEIKSAGAYHLGSFEFCIDNVALLVRNKISEYESPVFVYCLGYCIWGSLRDLKLV